MEMFIRRYLMRKYKADKPVVYIAGNYSNGGKASPKQRKKNREVFLKAQKHLYKNGYCPINPIELDYELDKRQEVGYNTIIGCDLALIAKSDFVLFLPKWYLSKGACIERRFARKKGIPIIDKLPKRRK